MNYKTIEENTNYAEIAGTVSSQPKLSHKIEGENFYEFTVDVERLSKIKDVIPVTASERTLMNRDFQVGEFVKVTGEYRSYNKLLDMKSKLVLHLFAKEIEKDVAQEYVNEVKLTGFICKEPVYRKTPFNREICDVLLAVNRPNYHKSDYVPCIMWGRNARFIANQNIGAKLELVGRIQSREYVKALEDGEKTMTAYEVSCQRMSIVNNVTNYLSGEHIESNAIIN
ncbi:MAG: single-stranded DNA-binding protein [Candidatus Caccovivens sp.]